MNIKVFIGLSIASLFNPATCKRYDLELEAIKLFGEDFNTVLARFRRTPEYLDILTDGLNELKEERDEFKSQLSEIYRAKLLEKINGIFGANVTGSHPLLRNGARNLRRQSETNQNSSSYLAEAVETLDSHPTLHSLLTVDERNRFKDIGFEMSGLFIHDSIKSMEPGDAPQMSTQQPGGDGNPKVKTTTTEHNHEVTSVKPITIYANAQDTTKGTGGSTRAPKRYKHKRVF